MYSFAIMSEDLIKDDRQHSFNEIKGVVYELNTDEMYCSLTINVGHLNVRPVNLVIKKQHYYKYIHGNFKVGDKVKVRFFLSSKFKHSRWYTTANILQVDPCK